MRTWMLLTLFLVASTSYQASAQVKPKGTTDITILPVPGPNMSDVVVDSNLTMNTGNSTIVDIYLSCYGTNLRSVANPLSPLATITASFNMMASDNSIKNYSLKFSAAGALAKQTTVPNADLSSSTVVKNAGGTVTSEKFSARLQDSMIRAVISNGKTVGLDVLATGSDYGKLADAAQKTAVFRDIGFEQEMPSNVPVMQYLGADGLLTASTKWSISENGKHISVYAAFPGENGFCGGFYSPLMLKFNNLEKLPEIKKKAKFVLSDQRYRGIKPGSIAWPSFAKDDEIYFLGLDKNGNGLIDNGGELFGDINGYKDGFDNLAAYDENKDGVIDEKDSIFSKLVLWKDSNHDGICKKNELVKLSDKGVTSISLTFVKNLEQVSQYAKVYGPGTFTYKDSKGVLQAGKVWDVFLDNVP